MVRPRPADDSGVVTQLAMLLVVSLVAGVLAAGLALPVVGAAGAVARNSAQSFDTLPSDLQTPPLPQTSVILAADGSVIARIYSENRIVVPLKSIAPVMQHAVVAIEDSRFYEHGGVDIHGALRALAANLQSGSVQEGASTLTMQYVRNVLVVSAQTDAERAAARAVNTGRKLREMRLAIGLETKWTKAQILEGYLNIAYFGAGAYGAEAAARRYFSTSAAKLTLSEAATLAGIVQQPVAFDPLLDPAAAQQRRDVVLDRMLQLGDITQAERDAAAAIPMAQMLKPRQVANGCTTSGAPFFCDYVMHVLLNDPAFGKTADDRKALIDQGGLTIRTTLDTKAQSAAQASIEKYIPYNDPSGKAAALAMVEPGTGNIMAMAAEPPLGRQRGRLHDVQLRGRQRRGRHRGDAGRVDVQGVHAGGGPRAGHPAQPADRRPPDQDVHRVHRLQRQQVRPLHAEQLDRGRHVQPAHRHGAVDQHLLRRGGAPHRHLPAGRDRRGARGPLGRRQAAAAGALVHPRRRQRHAADDGRGLRHLRGPRQALRVPGDRLGDRPQRQAAGRSRRCAAARCSTRPSPTASPRSSRASSTARSAVGPASR